MIRIITQAFILFVVALLLPSLLFGQAKSITSENYYTTLKDAESRSEKLARKIVSIQKLYSNGEITATLTDTVEYLPPDKSRWISVEDRGRPVKKIEQITIGNLVYRKEGDGEWVKRQKDDFGMGIGGTDNSAREYFSEETIVGKEKIRVLTEKRVNYNKTFFDEIKIWINEKGIIVKKTSTTSRQELKNIVSSIDESYDYGVKLEKIEAPKKSVAKESP